MRKLAFTLLLIVLLMATLGSCKNGDPPPVPTPNPNPTNPIPPGPNPPPGPGNPNPPTNPSPDPTPTPDPTPQPDDGTCTTLWNKDITVPTTLSDTPKLCDYLLEGFVEISSRLIIEPGVVIRAKEDAIIWVDGGEFLATGNAQSRITLEGLNHLTGYWKGIRFAEARESHFDYVDLKDAGQECGVPGCPKGALVLDDVTVSFANSTVSNSYVHGLNAEGDVLFTKFENNRFYDNTWAGILIDAKYIPVLDTASDYLGEGAINGTPYVQLASGDLDDGDTRTWKNLNAPYLIGGYLDIEGGIVILEPGTTVVFGKEDWLHVEGNGELRAIGTPEARITFKGEVEKPGYWDGITFWDSNWEENELSYVDIKHSGNVSGLLDAYGGVRMKYTSSLKINNSNFSDNDQYGISCDEPDNFDTVTLTLGTGNTFSNNAAGDIDPDCGVTP